MASTPSPAAPATGPRLNLPIFLLALFGVLVVVHLWVQQQANFAFGCTGAGDAASGTGCAEVTSSIYSEFLGVSLLVWGGLFYVVVAALRLGVAATRPPLSETLRTASFVAVGLGFLFVIYLVSVQAFVLEQFCVLCLLSSLTTTAIFVLHLVERMKGTGPAVAASVALQPYVLAAVALIVLAGADLLFAGDGNDAVVAPDGQRAVQTASQKGWVSASCHYDFEAPQLSVFDQLITMQTPHHGSTTAPVRALKIFDPNCPHCKNAHQVLSGFVSELEDRATFYYHPHALWDHSVPQIQALMIAQEQGKFFEMLEGEFANQPNFAALHRARQGNEAQWLDSVIDGLKQIAEPIGMDAESLEQDIRAGRHVDLIRQRAQMVNGAGIRSVPRLVIEGHVMANTGEAWSQACIGGLIDQEIAQAAPAEEVAPAEGAPAPAPSES